MKRKNLILTPLVLLFFITAAPAQNEQVDKIKPQWLHKLPKPTDSTFKYVTTFAEGETFKTAQDDCLQKLVATSGLSSGVTVSSKHEANEILYQVWENGKLKETYTNESKFKSTITSNPSKLYIEEIDTYHTKDKSGKHYLTSLYAVSELSNIPLFDNVERTERYVSDPATWGLALIPGAAQFHKGSYLKGGLILGGTVALVGGIIFTENQRADYVNKIAKTHDADIKRAYATRRDHYATGRNICIGAVAALYVYNLIDAIIAPGARRVVVQKRPNGNTYAFTPTILDGNATGMAVSMTF